MYNDTYRPSVKSPGNSRLIPVGGESVTALLNYNLQKVRTNVASSEYRFEPVADHFEPHRPWLLPVPQSQLLAWFRSGLDAAERRQTRSRRAAVRSFPTVNFNTEGYTRFGDDIASDNYFHTFTALDTVTLIRGNHTFKIGGEVQQHRDNYRNYGNGGGTFNFTR